MGIDGIGKPPPPGGLGPAGGVRPGEASPIREAFKVERTAGPEKAAGTDALARLERGEIDVEQYLDAKVDGAVAHLDGRIGGEQLEFVKTALREQLRTDPVLTELVRRSTGSLPDGG
ncbi:MAG: hypothetical protein IT375_36065 [Polyangiaceae bacterium]|jgi:hypothetical protein|nr:hypothetical protein [Polyangiaceae bacterium]